MNVSGGTPSELAAIIGLKFTFAVNININSYYAKERIFNVNSVIQAHGKQKEPVDELSVAAQIQDVRNRTLTLIERENDTRSWSNFLIYFSHYITMPCPPKDWRYILIGC
jgi:hypothetical protein